ncbi:MAG: 3-oxoacyl-ACP reductase FabG [Actinobacteria bacterium]|nr:3-oxoacyl-ACP reductase FabG [Actinomycetota bacterium]
MLKNKRLEGKVSIVTGAGRGIGEAIALRYGIEGSKVVIVDIEDSGMDVSKEIIKNGGVSIFIKADLAKPADIDKLEQKVLDEYGTIDILVNNAGVAVKKPITECTLEDWDFVHNLDMRGLWYLTRAVTKTMIKKRSGKIINIASITGVVGYVDQSIYAAAKGGVVNLTRELGIELAPHGINVNAICPGITDTPIYESFNFSLKKKENAEGFLKDIPINRIGNPEDIAGAALFLASGDSDYVVGAILMVDGGWVAH